VITPASTFWERLDFTAGPGHSTCKGDRYVKWADAYSLFVGVQLCEEPGRYKIYLSATREGEYDEIADTAGDGEDHCELVNPAFRIPNEDNIKSGGCSSCANDPAIDFDPPQEMVWSRADYGLPFTFGPMPRQNYYSSNWYECGVTVP
jgi:hypothetical protein